MELYTLLIDGNSESSVVTTTIHGAAIMAKSVSGAIRSLKEIEGKQIEPEDTETESSPELLEATKTLRSTLSSYCNGLLCTPRKLIGSIRMMDEAIAKAEGKDGGVAEKIESESETWDWQGDGEVYLIVKGNDLQPNVIGQFIQMNDAMKAAAAPELLEAAKVSLHTIHSLHRHIQHLSGYSDSICALPGMKLRRAIAKAEGKDKGESD